MKFQNAIRAILNNPDDPGFAPYRNNLFSAGVALQNGSDKALLASSMAAYLRDGLGVYQSNMSVNGDPDTGVNAWNNLDPALQQASQARPDSGAGAEKQIECCAARCSLCSADWRRWCGRDISGKPSRSGSGVG